MCITRSPWQLGSSSVTNSSVYSSSLHRKGTEERYRLSSYPKRHSSTHELCRCSLGQTMTSDIELVFGACSRWPHVLRKREFSYLEETPDTVRDYLRNFVISRLRVWREATENSANWSLIVKHQRSSHHGPQKCHVQGFRCFKRA